MHMVRVHTANCKSAAHTAKLCYAPTLLLLPATALYDVVADTLIITVQHHRGVPGMRHICPSEAHCCIAQCHADAVGVEYSSRNVLTDPDLREGVKKFSEWPTIPQVYIDGEFVGGSDILMGMHENGELSKMFKA